MFTCMTTGPLEDNREIGLGRSDRDNFANNLDATMKAKWLMLAQQQPSRLPVAI